MKDNNDLVLNDIGIIEKILRKEIAINDLNDDVKMRLISLCKKRLDKIKEKNLIKSNQIIMIDQLLKDLKI